MEMLGGKNYEMHVSGDIIVIEVKGPFVVNQEFQNEIDKGIARVASFSKAKLLVIAQGSYSIDPVLREKMALPGVESPVGAIAFVSSDARWNDINAHLVAKNKPPFIIQFFDQREPAEEWLRTVICK